MGKTVSTELNVHVVAAEQYQERMLRLFGYEHLPQNLQAVSKPFFDLARSIAHFVPNGPERTVGLRKLLEAKDATVRAVAMPD